LSLRIVSAFENQNAIDRQQRYKTSSDQGNGNDLNQELVKHCLAVSQPLPFSLQVIRIHLRHLARQADDSPTARQDFSREEDPASVRFFLGSPLEDRIERILIGLHFCVHPRQAATVLLS